ncbi:MAG: DUF6134 family protein, partial [Pseudomonadota bacterium]
VSALGNAMAADLPKDLHFQVFMGQKDIGDHIIKFTENEIDGRINVDIDIDLKVKYAFITFFEYAHDNSEVWEGNTLISLNSDTMDDGRDFFVDAQREGEVLIVEGSRGSFEKGQQLTSTSHWNRDALLQAEALLNSQKGDLLEYSLTKIGSEEVVARGETVMADKYFLDAKIDTTLWYAQETGEWVKMTFDAKGREIRYELVDPNAESETADES